jgi:hypothetical protein
MKIPVYHQQQFRYDMIFQPAVSARKKKNPGKGDKPGYQ